MSNKLAPAQRNALRLLGAALPDEAYLAGDVAVALTFEHRTSRDLDFFLPEEFAPERLADELQKNLAGSSLAITSTAKSTLYLELDHVAASVIAYGYPLLLPAERASDLGARVASLEDLTGMKLSAIAARGAARDFWDLYMLLEGGTAGGTISGALELYGRKFATHDIGHVVRALAYFGDADAAPLPGGLDPARWSALKEWFAAAVRVLD